MLQDSEIGAIPSGDPFGHPPQSKYEKLISMAKEVQPATTVVAHPCDETSLRGASAAVRAENLNPDVLVMQPANQGV